MLDIHYIGGKNEFDSTGVNYAQIQSAAPKVARQLLSEFETIDGIDWGNRGFADTARGSADDQTVKAWRRGCEDVMTRCQRQGLVRDWTVTVEASGSSIDTLIEFYDVPASTSARLSLAPPWAR